MRVNGGTQYVQRWAGRDTVGTDSGPVKPSRQVGGDSSRGNGNFGPVADVRTAASENLLVNRARTPAARASKPCLPGCVVVGTWPVHVLCSVSNVTMDSAGRCNRFLQGLC